LYLPIHVTDLTPPTIPALSFNCLVSYLQPKTIAMSTATWRQFFTYCVLLILICCGVLIVKKKNRYNKYTQIAARAVRQSLKENERVVAERRGLTSLRYQHWENGKGGDQVFLHLLLLAKSADLGNRHFRCISTRLLTRRSAMSCCKFLAAISIE
jgi:F-type H+-transporting ATPase subunit epsilon